MASSSTSKDPAFGENPTGNAKIQAEAFDVLLNQILDKVMMERKLTALVEMLPGFPNDDVRLSLFLNEKLLGLVPMIGTHLGKFIKLEEKSFEKAERLYKLGLFRKDLEDKLSHFTAALALCPLPPGDLPMMEEDTTENYQILLDKASIYKEEHDNLFSKILSMRASTNYDFKNFESALIDSYRAFGFGCRVNPETVAIVASSLFCMGRYKESVELYIKCTQLLRHSPVSNQEKATLTTSCVKWIRTCKEKLSSKDIPKDGSSPQDSWAPQLHPDLEFQFSRLKGRHMVAKNDISAGTTLIVDHAYSWIMFENVRTSTCDYCCQKTHRNIPCPTCSLAMFCSVACRKKAQRFHKWECPVIEELRCMSDMGRLALRTILMTEQNELFKFATMSDQEKSEENFVHGKISDGQFDPSKYVSVYAQLTNSHKRNGRDIFLRIIYSVYMVLLLRSAGYFKKPKDSAFDQDFVVLFGELALGLSEAEFMIGSLLLRHLQSSPCNAYSIEAFTGGKISFNMMEIGGATYPTVSCLNHACNPNVYRYLNGNVCMVKAIKDVKKGEELLDNYVYPYSQLKRDKRQQELVTQFFFLCDCAACQGDWGTYAQMQDKSIFEDVLCPCGASKWRLNKLCKNCGKKLNFTLQKTLTDSQAQFVEAKGQILNSINDPKLLKIYTDRLELIMKHYPENSKFYVEAQEALKLAWNLQVASIK